jgi:hypothetical protein
VLQHVNETGWAGQAMSYLPTATDFISYPKSGGGWGNLGSDLRTMAHIPQLRYDPSSVVKSFKLKGK